MNQVNLGGEFSPLKPKPIFTLDSLAFLLLNVLSVGIYGTVQITLNARSISRLDLSEENLKKTAAALLMKYNALEQAISGLRASVMRGDEINADNICRLMSKAVSLPTKYDGILLAQDQVIQAVALSAIQMIGDLLLNLTTLGLYGVYQNHLQLSKIANAEAKNNYIGEKIRQKIGSFSVRLQNEIQEIRSTDLLNQEEKRALATEAGQAYKALKNAEADMEGVRREILALNNQLLALQTNQATLQQGTAQLLQKYANLEAQRIELETALQNLKNSHQVLPQAEIDELKRIGRQAEAQKEDLKSALDQKNNHEMQLLGLNQALSAAEKEQLNLGPIPPQYIKQANDLEVDGASGLEDHDMNLSNYARCYNDKKTALEVVKAGLDSTIARLLALGEEIDPKIHFNKSAMIYSDDKYEPNRNAVYRYLAHEFIANGKLFQDGCSGFSLKLNKDGVYMGSSQPERVQCYEIDAFTGERRPEVRILPTHIDEFSPSIGDRDLLFGIDPASAKWIFARLNEDEKDHLYHLLMDPLIANEDAGLIAAKNFMKGKSERVKLVDTAYRLICNIATALDKKFGKTSAASEAWGELDEWDDTVLPFEKPEIGIESIVDPSSVVRPVVEWKPDYVSIKGSFRSSFGTAIENSVNRYKKIYAGITAEAINNSNRILYPAVLGDRMFGKIQVKGLAEQFEHKHKMFGPHGCLISNITAVLMTDYMQAGESSAKNLKEAMADFLGKASYLAEFENKIRLEHKGMTVAQYFENKIQSTHKTSVLQYRKWLKGENGASISNSDLGDVEIEIIAQMMGVKFAVFYEGMTTKLNEYNLTIPEIICYGPNTKEMFFLYNNKGSTYYSLWPKLNPAAFADAEAGHACIDINNYVSRL